MLLRRVHMHSPVMPHSDANDVITPAHSYIAFIAAGNAAAAELWKMTTFQLTGDCSLHACKMLCGNQNGYQFCPWSEHHTHSCTPGVCVS